MKIIVLGYIVRGPLGGLVWHHLQYMVGLKKLGYDVLFLEDSDDFPSCYNPETNEMSDRPIYGLKFIDNIFDFFGLKHQWAYFDAHTGKWYGQTQRKVFEFCSNADVVLNLSGVNPVRDWWATVPCRAYVDTDPAFTQIKHLTNPLANEQALQHTCFFSFGENIGKKECSIPDDGFIWKATRQPVYLEAWKLAPPQPNAKWTTIMQWDSYNVREHNKILFGMKSESFKEYELLPEDLQNDEFELALGSSSAPSEELKNKGWSIINPLIPTRTPWSYQEYIAASKAEWSVAKHGYVISNSGWFSERSLCYMASAKPVVVQDTGFSQIIETGNGLLSFKTLEQAIENIHRVNKDYKLHCEAARNIVMECFESKLVLNELIRQL